MPNDLENYFKNHLWWWAGIFLALGATATVATGKFLYVDPRDRDIATLQRQLEEARSGPESQRLPLLLQQIQSSRDECMAYARTLESKISTCDANAAILSELSKLSEAKKEADRWVDFFLSPKMNSGTDPSKTNMLRAEEYRRQATQLQEQILGLQARISR